MGRVNADYKNKQTVSDIFTLTNVVTGESIALIPSDSAGNFSWTGITKAPIIRNAIQTSQTSGEWSDLEYPYMAIPQEDWTGGRASIRFSSDKSRFFDSRRAQTAYNSCIYNSPLEHYAEQLGGRKAYTNYPANLHWIKIQGSTSHLIAEIEVDSYQCGNVYVHLKRHGKPVSGLTVRLTDSMDEDREALAEHTYTTAEITDITAEFPKFSFDEITLDSKVYLEVFSDGATSENYWEIGTTYNTNSHTYRSNGVSEWDLYQYDLLYRLDRADVGETIVKFFTYEQLQFAVFNTGGSGSNIYMNGEIGKASAGGTDTITDDAKEWPENCWAGAQIGLVYRDGIEGRVSVWRKIVSNTSDTITVDSPWDVTPGDGTVYIVNDTPLWQEIGSTSYFATDIHVIRGVIYIAYGNESPVEKMIFNHGTGQFESAILTGVYADYLQSVRDRNGMMLYRARNDDEYHNRSVERSILLDYEDITVTPTFSETVDYIKGDYVKCDQPYIIYVEDPDNPGEYIEESVYPLPDDKENQLYQFKEDHPAGAWTGLDVIDANIVPEEGEYVAPDTPLGKIVTVVTTAIATTDGTAVTIPVDFGQCDYDMKQYVIDISTFVTGKNDGKVLITLQESEDGYAFYDVQSITAGGTGRYYLTAHCQYRYRRLSITPTGQNCSVNKISVRTSQIPHFVDRITLLDNYGKITRIYEYGSEQEKSLWVFQEGMVSSINKTENTVDTYNLDRMNLDELQVTAEEWNGKAISTTDVYLLWSWLNGIQRHYNTQLEGKGPDHDEGMPKDMQGRITQIIAYPGSFFASIDAGENGYSSIMFFNGSGWHNLYRAPNKGERIHDMSFQPIYGTRPDRLWAQVGDNIIWLAMPSKILYALQDPNAEYTHESVVVSAWITGGMAEVDKLWQSISIMADHLDGKTCWIEADYQLDDEEEWHPIPNNPYTESPQQEEDFAGLNESINGKKLRWRLRINTSDIHKTPKVNVVLVKAVGRVDIKYSYGFHFRNIKYKADLTGEYEEIEPYELDHLLNDWANRLCTLRLNSAYRIFDDKKVFMDALQTSVVYEKSEGYLSQITLTEI